MSIRASAVFTALVCLLFAARLPAVVFDSTSADWTGTPFGNWVVGNSTWAFNSKATATSNSNATVRYQVITSVTTATWNAQTVNCIQVDENFGTNFNISLFAKGTDGGIYRIGSNGEDDAGNPISGASPVIIWNTKPRLICPATIVAGTTWTDAVNDVHTIVSLGLPTQGGLPSAIRFSVASSFHSAVPNIGIAQWEDNATQFAYRMPNPTFAADSADLSSTWLKGWAEGSSMWPMLDHTNGDRQIASFIHTNTIETVTWNGQSISAIRHVMSNQNGMSVFAIAKGTDGALYQVREWNESTQMEEEVLPAQLIMPAQPAVGQSWDYAQADEDIDQKSITSMSGTTRGGFGGAMEFVTNSYNSTGGFEGIDYDSLLPGIGWADSRFDNTVDHPTEDEIMFYAGPFVREVPNFATGCFWFYDNQGRWAITSKDGVQANDDIGFAAILPSGYYLHYQASDTHGDFGPEIGVWRSPAFNSLQFTAVDDDNGDVGLTDPGRSSGVTVNRILGGGHGDLVSYNEVDREPEFVMRRMSEVVPRTNRPKITGLWATADGAGLLEPGAKGFVFTPDQHYMYFERTGSNTVSGTFLVDYGTFTSTYVPGTLSITFDRAGGNAISGPIDLSTQAFTFGTGLRLPVDYGSAENQFVWNAETYGDVVNGINDGISDFNSEYTNSEVPQSIRVTAGQFFDVPLTNGTVGAPVAVVYTGEVAAEADAMVRGTIVATATGGVAARIGTRVNPLANGERYGRGMVFDPSGSTQIEMSFELVVINAVITTAPAPSFHSTLRINALVGGQVITYVPAANATRYSASGLPSGLAIDALTGQIYGRPAAAGLFAATVTATGPGGSSTLNVSIVVGAALTALVYSDTYIEGESGVLTVEIGRPAPAGGLTFTVGLFEALENMVEDDVPLQASDVVLPATVTIPQGAWAATLPISIPVNAVVNPHTRVGGIKLSLAGTDLVGGSSQAIWVYERSDATLVGPGKSEYFAPAAGAAILQGANIAITQGESLQVRTFGRQPTMVRTNAGQQPLFAKYSSQSDTTTSIESRQTYRYVLFTEPGVYNLELRTGLAGVDAVTEAFTVTVAAPTLPVATLSPFTVAASSPESPVYTVGGPMTTDSFPLFQNLLTAADDETSAVFGWDTSLQGWAKPAAITPGLAVAVVSATTQAVVQTGTPRPFLADVITLAPRWNLLTFPAAAFTGATTAKTTYASEDLYYIDPAGWLASGSGLGYSTSSDLPRDSFTAGQGYWLYNGFATETVPVFILPPADGPGIRSMAGTKSRSLTTASRRLDHRMDAPSLPTAGVQADDQKSSGGCGGGSGAALMLGGLLAMLRFTFMRRRSA